MSVLLDEDYIRSSDRQINSLNYYSLESDKKKFDFNLNSEEQNEISKRKEIFFNDYLL